MKVTDCTCTGPGWCERHQCDKRRDLFECCQRLPAHFAAWERGEMRFLCRKSPDQPERKSPCRHLGEERRQSACQTCRGSVRIKVFECEQLGECVLGRAVEDLTSCLICSQYEPVANAPSQSDPPVNASGESQQMAKQPA